MQLLYSILFLIFILLVITLICLIISTRYDSYQFLDSNQKERWNHVEIETNILIKDALNNFLFIINIFTWIITRFFDFCAWLYSFILQ